MASTPFRELVAFDRKGPFTCFPNVTGVGWDTEKLADYLLEEAGVAALSGTAFGSYGKDYLRLSYANSVDNLKKAIERMDFPYPAYPKMKAVVLAAGRGRRLAPYTDNLPKPMVEVGGAPFLAHILDRLKAVGILEVFLIVNYLSEKIEGHFGDGSQHGFAAEVYPAGKPYGGYCKCSPSCRTFRRRCVIPDVLGGYCYERL